MNDIHNKYWTHGLHDAIIIDIKYGELYEKFRFNSMTFLLDTEGVMGEDIKEITFYNFSIVWKGNNIKDFSRFFPILINSMWLNDKLTSENGRHAIDLNFQNEATEIDSVKILFEDIDVKR